MKKISIPGICIIIALVALAIWAPDAVAYLTYQSADDVGDNCSECHPGFQNSSDPTHQLHVSAMTGNCALCHPSTPGSLPVSTFSSGDGVGCIGCHEENGLRLHHTEAGVEADMDGFSCTTCHPSDPTPAAENIVDANTRPYYLRADVNLSDPCVVAPIDGGEDYSGDGLGLDNDGDLLYDGNDPDCEAPECTVDADCDNGVFCDGVETCDAGTCVEGTPPSCDDGVACTDDSCDPSIDDCVNTANDGNCDDNDVCNGIETCDPTLDCEQGTPLDCDDGNLCTTDSCDSLTGCANVPVECSAGEQCDPADGICKAPPECTVDTDCDDTMFCNGAETCNTATGTCQTGTPPDCDDGVVCTVDTCDETNDACVNTPDDASCDDNNVCNGIETCDSVNDCQPGTPLDCDDVNSCTTDSCDPLTGCANVPVECPAGEQCDPADGICKVPPECTVDEDCDDGFFCDGAETCDPATGICQSGTPPDCDDGVVCTLDTCDEANDTCVNTADDASCDDGDVCNGTETCDPVNDCQPGEPLVCDDGNHCTTDSCDRVAGCVFPPVDCPVGEQCDPADGECRVPPECTVDTDCDDGMFCNGAETCDSAAGTCQSGNPVDCDDGVDCTVDTCDETNDGCLNTPDDAACPDDGLFCTGQEICDPAGGCLSTGDPCPEGTTCNEDTDACDMVTGKVTICHIPPGHPARARTLRINAVSVADHLAHGDLLGPCP